MHILPYLIICLDQEAQLDRGKSLTCSSVRNLINPEEKSELVEGIDRYSGIINSMQMI